ncbi:ImmA/IrrE family metallo-endopeptidase [Micromonospora sp. NPDC005194]|uniref:ImmA/IrrE family metallo-endopeptidase n=1 Tax=Micromonospora sp. NPDC005194 TaxID=3156870 RepID=UPI0033A0EB3F
MTTRLTVPSKLLLQLRACMPKGPLTYGQALTVAEQQAIRLRELLGVRTAKMPFDWVEHVPNLTLQVLPAHEIERLAGRPASGLTRWNQQLTYLVAVNKNTSFTHRRYTLAHEIKHVIDCPAVDTAYAQIGYGNDELRSRRIEGICDHFSAHLLMPNRLVSKAWHLGIQGLSELASQFGVSEDAMQIRLSSLGLVDPDKDKPTSYFFREAGASRFTRV